MAIPYYGDSKAVGVDCSYYASIREAAERIKQDCGGSVNGLIHSDTKTMIDRFVDVKADDKDRWKIQKIVTDIIERKIRDTLYEDGTAEDRARLTALTAQHSMLVERVSRPHISSYSRLDDSAAVFRNRMVLGMPPTNDEQKCYCGQPLTLTHVSACIKVRKMCVEPRHDMVRDTIKDVFDHFNIPSLIEYRPLAYSDGERRKRIRPDGKTHLLDALWDVAVTTPTCKTYIEKHSDSTKLVAAKVNETAKHAKYDGLAAEEGVKFYPLIFEAFGGFGKTAVDFINLAADRAVDISGGGLIDRSQIIDYIRSTIAFAIANGNASLIRNAIRLAAKRRSSVPSQIVVRPMVRARPPALRIVRRS
jgi:hypothetical protein